METIDLRFDRRRPLRGDRRFVLVGVVASGNLEVLLERTCAADECRFHIETAAHGFKEIWAAVLEEFIAHHDVGGAAFSINDAGATPAVVMLRLQQALEDWNGGIQ
jgi:malonate decarboxylase acyl carrier protein